MTLANVIPFLGRRRTPERPLAAETPAETRIRVKTALQAALEPPRPHDRYHVAPVWRGTYTAGFSVWDRGRNADQPRRLRLFMVADLGLHIAAGRAISLRDALNDEWRAFQARKLAQASLYGQPATAAPEGPQ